MNELRPTRVLELLSKHSIQLELINSLNSCTFDGVPNKICAGNVKSLTGDRGGYHTAKMCKTLGLAISDRQHHFHMLWFGSVEVQCMFFTDGDGQYNDTYDRYRQCIISGKIDSGRWIRLPRCRFVLLRFRSHEMTFPPRSNECHS